MADTTTDVSEQFALIFADGSMGVMCPDICTEAAIKEARAEDPNEHDPEQWAKLARVRIEVIETIPYRDPSPPSAVETLRVIAGGEGDLREIARQALKRLGASQ